MRRSTTYLLGALLLPSAYSVLIISNFHSPSQPVNDLGVLLFIVLAATVHHDDIKIFLYATLPKEHDGNHQKTINRKSVLIKALGNLSIITIFAMILSDQAAQFSYVTFETAGDIQRFSIALFLMSFSLCRGIIFKHSERFMESSIDPDNAIAQKDK